MVWINGQDSIFPLRLLRISSGAVLVATADYIWGLGLLARADIGVVLGVALLITYVVGQAVAQFSSFFFEQLIVHRVLKRPSSLLEAVV